MDKIKTVKIKNEDGSISEETYTISVDALNVDMANNKNLQETIGTINIDTDGNIAYQLENLKNNKVNKTDIIDNLNSTESNKVLSANQGKVLGDAITILNEDVKKKAYYFDTVADMKNANLEIGDYVCTLGYYEINDGGASHYIVIDGSYTDDGSYYHQLNNNLFAKLIIDNNIIVFNQLGAKSNDNTFDNKNYLLNYVNICKNLNKNFELVIPNGKWYFSPTHIAKIGGVNIKGMSSFYGGRGNDYGSQILAIADQDYIWKFGGTADMLNSQLPYNTTNTSNKISGLTFSSNPYKINYGALVLEYANYGLYEDLTFRYIIGTGLYMRSCWENYFNKIFFRTMADYSKPCWYFAKIREISGVSANISSSSFDKIMYESSAGDMMYFEYGCAFINNQIGEINIENSVMTGSGDVAHSITAETDLSEMTPVHVINGYLTNTEISRIVITGQNSMEHYITNSEGNNFYYKSIINIGDYVGATQANLTTFTVGNIVERSNNQILSCNSSYPDGCSVIINSINGESNDTPVISYNKIDVKDFGKLIINNITTRFNKDMLTSPINEVEFYKFCRRGCISSHNKANNQTKLVAMKNPGSVWLVSNTLKYPFQYSTTKTKVFGLKLMPNENGHYYISVRGVVNGEEVTRNYTGDVSTGSNLITIPIYMNFDFGSDIRFFNPTANVGFQSLYYIREEDIQS